MPEGPDGPGGPALPGGPGGPGGPAADEVRGMTNPLLRSCERSEEGSHTILQDPGRVSQTPALVKDRNVRRTNMQCLTMMKYEREDDETPM